jgi:REP element-mobilizing transposase RayT
MHGSGPGRAPPASRANRKLEKAVRGSTFDVRRLDLGRRYLYWLFEAKKRYGLCVLDYMVTSNHVHLLVKDTGGEAIAQSMQLIAGRTAQEYNQRKRKQGASWEDRSSRLTRGQCFNRIDYFTIAKM